MMKNTVDDDMATSYLLKRKDFLGVDEEAGSHPNRTYYLNKNLNLDHILENSSRKLSVIMCNNF